MTTDKILIVSSSSTSSTMTKEIELDGYHVFSCLPKREDVLQLAVQCSVDLVILFNLTAEEESQISVLLKEHLPKLNIVTNSCEVIEGKAVLRLGTIEVTDKASSEALMLNKLRIQLRLMKIKEMSERLVAFKV